VTAIQAVDVLTECRRQDEKWGPRRNHDSVGWFFILMEEVGEAAEAVLVADREAGGGLDARDAALLEEAVGLGRKAEQVLEDVGAPVSMCVPECSTTEERKEAMQIAAVALQWMMTIDDRKGSADAG